MKRHHHHYHHHHRPACDAWFWIILLFIVAIIVTWTIVWWVRPLPPPPPPPPDPVKISSIVFKKRAQRHECTVGETYVDGLCGPTQHVPSAFEDTIMDGSTAACDSLYRAACGRWLDAHSNEDRMFGYSYHRNKRVLEHIVTNATGNGPLYRFYSSCMEASRNHYGHEAELQYRHVVDSTIAELRTYADVPAVMGKMARQGYILPFQLSIERDPRTKNTPIPFLAPDGFHNLTRGQVTAIVLAARPMTRYTVLQTMNVVDRAWKVIDACVQQQQRETGAKRQEEYVPDTVQFQHVPSWGWTSFLQAYDGSGLRFAAEQEVWIENLRYLTWFFSSYQSAFEVGDWLAYLEFSLLYHMHRFEPVLPNNVYRKRNATQGIEHDCVAITQRMLPGLVAKAFLQQQPYADRIQAEVTAMVDTLKNEYMDLLANASWFATNSSRQVAQDKVRSIAVRVTQPTGIWTSEPFADRIGAGMYDHNIALVRMYRVQQNLAQWTVHHATQDTFAFPLSLTNAYYNPEYNSITILAGILGPPWYHVDYNDVSKWAIVGTIVGHELAHALDWNGLHWTKDGIFTKDGILDKASMDSFQKQVVGPLAAQYRSPCDAGYGPRVVNEAIADAVGTRLAYNGLSPASQGDAQFFFMTRAQVWCASYDACSRMDDVHPLPKDRVDVTNRNMEEFAAAFNCRV